MKVTVLAALMVFAAYFLLLYAGVGFLQDKRFFGSAPKENLDAIPDRKKYYSYYHKYGQKYKYGYDYGYSYNYK